jgi:hypothetical protein
VSICSTFMFSDIEEIDLMYIKVLAESSLVKEWVIVEGAYTFRGHRRSLILRNILENDIRFKPYLNRMHVIENNINIVSEFKFPRKFIVRKLAELLVRKFLNLNYESQKRTLYEMKYFYAEKKLCDAALLKIFELSKKEIKWVFVSDVDEILNVEHSNIHDAVISLVNSEDLFILLYRKKFVFDFDNLDGQQRFTPLVNINLIKQMEIPSLSEFRNRFDGVIQTELPYVIEYSYCFSAEAIIRKLNSFPHVSPPADFIRLAMRVNSTFLYPDSNRQEVRWLNGVDISKYQVPKYVQQNLTLIKTNNINSNYKQNRKVEFSEIF